jgi:hypothetical protein
MQSDRSIFIQDAEIHLGGMQVDTTVEFMLLGVEIHEKASLVEVIKPYISILPQMMGRAIGGLLYYQIISGDRRARPISGFNSTIWVRTN